MFIYSHVINTFEIDFITHRLLGQGSHSSPAQANAPCQARESREKDCKDWLQ